MAEKTLPGADVLVIFGITGDLAHMMTFHALYRLEAAGLLDCPIIGVAKDSWSTEQLLDAIGATVRSSGEEPQPAVMSGLAARLSYVRGDVTDPATYRELATRLTGRSRPLFYLEIPPALFGPVVSALAHEELLTGAAVMIEKPFGHDLASARALNDELHQLLVAVAVEPGGIASDHRTKDTEWRFRAAENLVVPARNGHFDALFDDEDLTLPVDVLDAVERAGGSVDLGDLVAGADIAGGA